MPDDSENGQRELSDSEEQGKQLVQAVQGAIDDWVADEEIAVRREGEEIVAKEEQLVENISIIVALTASEFDS